MKSAMLSTRRQVRPDATGLGCRRCATSWLHSILNQHPRVCKPANGLHYFSENYEKGADWYGDQLGISPPSSRIVEFSVSYTYPEYSEQAAERICALAPDAKLFVTVRNPVDRAFSDYLRSTRMLELPANMSFGDAIEAHPVLLERSLYGKVLAPFFERFDRQQICVLFYEDLVQDDQAFHLQLMNHLEIEPAFEAIQFGRIESTGKRVRSPLFSRAVRAAKNTVGTVGERICPRQWQAVKTRCTPFYARVLDRNEVAASVPEETRRELREYFRSDLERFGAFVDRELTGWQ